MRRDRHQGRLARVACLAAGLLLCAGGDAAAQAGSIEGVVELERLPPRRTANRYGGGSAAAEEVQDPPAVVYLIGSVPGSASPDMSARMVQRDTSFAPSALMVGVGGSVDFPNEDPFFHNVFSYSSGARFDLGRYPQGQSKSVDFPEAGVVSVFCEVHDKMRGVIVVTENPHHAIVAPDGSFRIDGVPPGEYQVAFWSPDHDPVEETVTVVAGQATRVEVELRR